ncbi:hypothetical protein [Maribacter luteus]|uniref:hypothetical protein n=1 Tax=Maribacter luteus TaxID=2594478 RepID=UPI002491AD4F|nr:hypothetical protein [Maribacter luteus]
MSSAGHILDMIKRLGQNRSLRASNRLKFKGDNRETIYSGTDKHNKAIFKEFPKEQVEQAVNQIKQDSKVKRRKELTFLISIISVTSILMIYWIISSTDYSKKPQVNYTVLSPPKIWSGKQSDPIKVPFSNYFYSPFTVNMEFEVQIDKSYTMYDNDMVVDNTINILFFDNECNFIGKLLPKNGYISWMFVGPTKEGLGPKKVLYSLSEMDTNNDGFINENDRPNLYMSELNGKNLTRITELGLSSIQWVGKGNEIQIKFNHAKESNDSLYGIFNTETKEIKFTNTPFQSE